MVKKHKEHLIRPGNEEYLSYYKKQNEPESVCTISLTPISSSPGPAIVNLPSTIGEKGHDPTKSKAPAYRIGIKNDKDTVSPGPGPGAYDIRNKTNKGTDVCHAPVIGVPLKKLTTFASPGPQKYLRGNSDGLVYRKSPAYTMRPRTKLMDKQSTAAARKSYQLPETLGPGRSPYQKSPCYSMSLGRSSYKLGTSEQNPGPAAHMLPPTDATSTKAPAFSMGTRVKSPPLSKLTPSPGPASNDSHMVKYHKPSTPRFSFGIRHSPFKAFQHFASEK